MSKKPTKKSVTKEKLRRKADKLIQEYIKLINKEVLCLLCGEKVMTVGHHFVYKAQSNATRYYIPNLIPLCRDCHLYAHRWQNVFSAKIVSKLGQEWFDDIEQKRREYIKANIGWYEMNIQILEELMEKIL